ncbi:arsenate reductase ArsC [Bacteroidales bacterium AH-315-I05]|nr:arsenate reductase ArsC [Bacteroidales bacterium AH-315-I05]
MKKILVLCTGNSCRSQMAEGFLKKYAVGRAEVYSAGIEAHGKNPYAIKVMKEARVDISHQESETADKYLAHKIDHVITVCDNARELCPVFPNAKYVIHHSFIDPANATGNEEEVLNVYRKVRDEIESFCREFAKNI